MTSRIIELAKQAGISKDSHQVWYAWETELQRFAELVRNDALETAALAETETETDAETVAVMGQPYSAGDFDRARVNSAVDMVLASLGHEFAKVLHDNLWELYDGPPAPVQEPDPCPGCRPGIVCRTPACGRLRLKAAPKVQPRKAVKLSDAVIREAADKADEGQETAEYVLGFAREVEAAVLKANGWVE
jgi:glycosyltransferase A (GT-A) superfamily protein (DUF2064 family)